VRVDRGFRGAAPAARALNRGPPAALPGLANEAQLGAGAARLLGNSGLTGISLTLLAARSTTPIQIKSFITVAGPAPVARCARAWLMSAATVRPSALVLPSAWRSRNRRWLCLLLCLLEIGTKVSMYQRMRSARTMGACLLRSGMASLFQLDLTVLGPTRRCRAKRECLTFLMGKRLSPADADDRGVPRGAVGLFGA